MTKGNVIKIMITLLIMIDSPLFAKRFTDNQTSNDNKNISIKAVIYNSAYIKTHRLKEIDNLILSRWDNHHQKQLADRPELFKKNNNIVTDKVKDRQNNKKNQFQSIVNQYNNQNMSYH